jgi:diadenosine tetraphosphate (Ap4A) HIT family hydrolase
MSSTMSMFTRPSNNPSPAGLEIPYTHAHVWPIHEPMSFPINPDEEDPLEPDWEKLDEAAGSIRRALKDLGFQQ